MRVLVNGLPYFSKKIVEDLNEFNPKNHYLFLDTYYSFWAKIKFFILLPFYDKVISMNGVSSPSGSLNWVLRWKKPLLMLWQGTDVVHAMRRYKDQTLDRKYIDFAKHYASTTWIIDELESIGVTAKMLSFLWLDTSTSLLSEAKKFKVLTYLGENREEFYGWEFIKNAASELNHIEFNVVGTNGKYLPKLENINFLGWVDKAKMEELFNESSVYVRMTEHDGNSHLIAESLSKGLEVVWRYPHPIGYLAKDSRELINQLSLLKAKFDKDGVVKSQKNIEWVRGNLQRDIVLQNVVNAIEEV